MRVHQKSYPPNMNRRLKRIEKRREMYRLRSMEDLGTTGDADRDAAAYYTKLLDIALDEADRLAWRAEQARARSRLRPKRPTVLPAEMRRQDRAERDLEIMRMAGRGWENWRIAKEAGCSTRTVSRVIARAKAELAPQKRQ